MLTICWESAVKEPFREMHSDFLVPDLIICLSSSDDFLCLRAFDDVSLSPFPE